MVIAVAVVLIVALVVLFVGGILRGADAEAGIAPSVPGASPAAPQPQPRAALPHGGRECRRCMSWKRVSATNGVCWLTGGELLVHQHQTCEAFEAKARGSRP